MKYTNLGSYKTINSFIRYKLNELENASPRFDTLFDLMFQEEENIMYEESLGYRIRKVTYKEAKDNATNYAYLIKGMLLNRKYDSVIGLYLDNSDKWISAFWGILKAGFKPLLLNKRLSVDVLNKTLAELKAVLVITDDDTIFKTTTIKLSELEKKPQDKNVANFGTEFFVMSSGTSDSVKICAYSAEEFKYILLQSNEIIKGNPRIKKHYKGELKLLAFLPFYHIFGLVAVYTWFAFYSRTFVGLKDLNPSTIQNTIKRHGATHIFAVPLLWDKTYEAAIKEIKNQGPKVYKKFQKGMKLSKKLSNVPVLGKAFRKIAFKQVREKMFGESPYFLIAGGSFISPDVISFFNLIGYHLADGYGMSEVGITSVELSNNVKTVNSCSIGKPLKYVLYQINNDNELLINSKAMARYIIENGQVINNKDTWYNSHDLASYNGRNYELLGRRDDLIVPLSGENLNPNLVEDMIKVDGINGLCLIQNPETKAPILLVSLTKYSTKEKFNDIKNNLLKKINDSKLAEQIGSIVYISDSLLNEDEFKLNRKRLTEWYFKGKLHEFKYEENQEEDDELSKNIKNIFIECLNLKPEEITLDGDFYLDYGCTSLDYYLISSRVEQEYGISLISTNSKLRTIREIVAYIRKKL